MQLTAFGTPKRNRYATIYFSGILFFNTRANALFFFKTSFCFVIIVYQFVLLIRLNRMSIRSIRLSKQIILSVTTRPTSFEFNDCLPSHCVHASQILFFFLINSSLTIRLINSNTSLLTCSSLISTENGV